ncbi:MAG: hypothetical protein Q7S56_04060, partial [Nanoarchaeota archaeon]|nr:hypothetical protein [Nanoarchaeota archaeon]
AVLVVGGISYFAFSGSSDDNIVNGTSGETGSGGTSGGSSGTGSGSGWCTSGSDVVKDFVSLQGDVEIIKNQVNGMKTYKGKSACFFEIDFKTTKATIENDIYAYGSGDSWVITSPGGGVGVEYHWVNGVCTEALYNGASIPCPPTGSG